MAEAVDPGEQTLWREADALLDRLLDLPAGERAAALAAWPVAPAVHARVLRLLAAHGGGGVLDAQPDVPGVQPVPDLAGRVLGRWRLQQRIGEGGMAVVYRAVSVAPPLDQAAAIKILALGSLARDPGGHALAREQALLSRLRHPFIAPFHEAGISADGTPWLAMGLVEGERIDAWCDREGADVATRVRLLLEVADAVAYAHRNLVIHRDIKPSNVLVDQDGHARLLDFGIGHLLDQAGERTATALRALTPDYAAPEQFSGEAQSTAIDVYGLGALLHRLLTGQPPSAADGATERPSRRVARDAAQPPDWRRQRARQLRGDLDTILSRALAARPQDRYASVDALAEDLRRWQAKRPILARGPRAGYRLRMFVRRNRLAVGAGCALVLALGAGVAGTLWQAQRATAQAALAEAAAERSRAQLAYLDSILEDLVAPTTTTARRRDTGELVRVAAQRARESLAGQEAVLAGVESSLSSVAERAGHYAQALALAEAAHARLGTHAADDVTARAHAAVALARLSRQADPPDLVRAKALAAEAEALAQAGAGPAARVAALTEHAIQLSEDDAADAATALFEQAGALCAALPPEDAGCDRARLAHGSLLYRNGRFADADVLLTQLVEARRQRLGDDHVLSFSARYLLAMNTLRAGEPREAQSMLDAVLAQQRAAYGRATRDTMLTLQGLTEAALASSDLPLARQLAEALVDDARDVTGDASPELAMAWSQIGNITFADGDYTAATAAYGESRRLYTQLYGADALATNIVTGNYADALRESGQVAESLVLQQQTLADVEQRFPDQPLRLAPRLGNTARTLVAAGRPEEAVVHYARAIALYREHLPEGYHYHVPAAYQAAALQASGRLDEARRVAREALAGLRAALGPDHRYAWEALAFHVQAECAAPATAACATAAGDARAALRHPDLPGHTATMLRDALGMPRPAR